jgi:drug/metabolite transporter (DMT)-like permease
MSTKARAELMLFVITCIWGSTFAIGKMVLEQVSPLQMMVVRFGIASFLFLLFGWKRIFPMSLKAVGKAAFLGILLFLGFTAQTIGLRWTTASKSAFITGMLVVFVPILQVVVERKPPKIGNVVGVIAVAVGLWFLTAPQGGSFTVGDGLTLLCAILFAGYVIYLDMISADMTALQLTAMHLITVGILSFFGLMMFGSFSIAVDGRGWAILAYLTLFSTVLSTLIQTRFQRDTTPTRAAVIFTIEPVVAAILAYLLLHDVLGVAGVAGGGLIVAGVLLSELSEGIRFLSKPVLGASTEEAPS